MAARQLGLVTKAQVGRLGVGAAEFDAVIAEGRLSELDWDVFELIENPVAKPLVDAYAGWLALRPTFYAWERPGAGGDLTADAVLSHASAARVLKMGAPSSGFMHFTAPEPLPEPRATRVHVAALQRGEVMLHEGVPVTTPHRTIIDLILKNTPDDEMSHVVTDAVYRDLVNLADLYRDLRQVAAERLHRPIEGRCFVSRFLPYLDLDRLSPRNTRAMTVLNRQQSPEPPRLERVTTSTGRQLPGSGTDVEFWHELVEGARTDSERERLALSERYERLYSVTARMLATRGDRTHRGGESWPEERARRWRELEATLGEHERASLPDEVPDPARDLISAPDGVGSVPVADAVEAWERRLARTDTSVGLLMIPYELSSTVRSLLTELRCRLAPGRPMAAVDEFAAEVSALAHRVADMLREPITGEWSSPHPATSAPAPRAPRPLCDDKTLPARFEELTTGARRAAETIPSADYLAATADTSVDQETAAAAADVLAVIEGTGAPGWRECYESIRPDRHMVYDTEWELSGIEPISFRGYRVDAGGLSGDPSPWWFSEGTRLAPLAPDLMRDWRTLSRERALITADLIDELAVRLQPGRWVGTIHFSAFPLQNFLKYRLMESET
ncbi:MAG: hypothetical protein J2P32_02325 [Actinobacteria bacterium]|nr:hypothetical protein [Actinomycetota bacterium]